jgi:hypothetical protein
LRLILNVALFGEILMKKIDLDPEKAGTTHQTLLKLHEISTLKGQQGVFTAPRIQPWQRARP